MKVTQHKLGQLAWTLTEPSFCICPPGGRTRLSNEAFSKFLQTIKELNGGKQTREETLTKAQKIFGVANSDLYGELTRLHSKHPCVLTREPLDMPRMPVHDELRCVKSMQLSRCWRSESSRSCTVHTC